MLAQGGNYEEILLQASADPTTGSPTISDRRLRSALQDMGIALAPAERRELDGFLADRAGASGTVQITHFLAAVGLPAQTVGFGGGASGQT